jgi:protein-S-isoprenylcysteine O-methyltransferase Ste14
MRRDVVQRWLVTFVPAAVLGGLAVTQAIWAIRDLILFAQDPNWMKVTESARSALYAAFVFGCAFTLFSNKVPRMRDDRALVAAAALTASFLMLGFNVLPTGPILWNAPAHVVEGGLVLTMIGAALALTALGSIGSSFSIVPEARTLVVTGPYRLLRHPMYLAELLMLFGVVVGFVRLTTLVGALSVVGLQIYRIHTEEKLLQGAFPATFADFTARTRFRLIPLLW